jgi:ArsR family transcriptional regulator
MNVENLEVAIFKALAHPIRLKIVKTLFEKELCVCELNNDVEFTQSNLSQHLKLLKDANILNQRKEGLKVFYSIKNESVKQLIKIVDIIVMDSIKEIKHALEGGLSE